MPSLLAILGLNASRFEAGLKTSESMAHNAGRNISSALGSCLEGALQTVGGMLALKKAMSEVMAIAEESKRLTIAGSRMGITAEEFDNYDAAAKKMGSSGEAVGAAFKKIAVSAIEAQDGNADLIAHFRTLGVSMDDLQRKSVKQLFDQIAGGLRGSSLDAAKLAAVIKTMGRSADELIPALKSGELLKANPFGEDNEAHNVNAQFAKDMGVFKKLWGKVWDEVLSPDANKEGAIYKTLTWLSGKTKKALGITEAPLPAPTDLKTVSAAEVRAEQGAKKAARAQEKKDLDEIRRKEEELWEVQRANALKRMTDQQKIVELRKREQEIVNFVNRNAGKIGQAGMAQAATDIEKLRGEREELERKGRNNPLAVNELQRIGAYVSDPTLDVHKKNEQHLGDIRVNIKAIKDVLARPNSGGGTQF